MTVTRRIFETFTTRGVELPGSTTSTTDSPAEETVAVEAIPQPSPDDLTAQRLASQASPLGVEQVIAVSDPAPPLPTKKKILVVDDEQGIRSLIAAMLTGQGYEVFQAATIEEANQILGAQNISLIVSDNNISSSVTHDGVEFSKTRPQNIPFILMSGKLYEVSLEGLNINTALQKPTGVIRDLPGTVNRILKDS